MSPSKTTEEPKMTLPSGHPQRAFVSPDLSLADGATLDPETEKLIEAQQAEVEAAAEHEDKVARAEAKAVEVAAKPPLTAKSSGS
jgi:hypothetical protein